MINENKYQNIFKLYFKFIKVVLQGKHTAQLGGVGKKSYKATSAIRLVLFGHFLIWLFRYIVLKQLQSSTNSTQYKVLFSYNWRLQPTLLQAIRINDVKYEQSVYYLTYLPYLVVKSIWFVLVFLSRKFSCLNLRSELLARRPN